MDILKNFGFNPVLFLAQIINFLIIFFIFKKFVYAKLLTILKKRQEEIRQGVESAQKSEKILAETKELEKEILKNARTKAQEIVSEAKKDAEEKKAEIINKAKAESEKIISDSRITIEKDRKETEAKLLKRVTQIAIEILEKSLKELFGEREQKIILKRAVKEIENE